MKFPRLAGPRADLVLAGALAVAGAVWAVANLRSGGGPLDVRAFPDKLLAPDASHLGFPMPEDRADRTAPVLINVVAALPVAVRRRLPYAAAIVSLGGVFALRGGLTWPGFLAVLICCYSAVAYGRHLAGALAILFGGAAVAAKLYSTSIPDIPGWLTPFAVLVPVGLAAATIRGTRARADAAARRADALERERDAATRAAIAEERSRIARELHDVVSHHVSVMIIQAGAAGKVLSARPDLAADALSAVEASGREAMAELRHMVGLVAPLDDTLRPQPGPDDLEALVASVRAAGQPVTFRCGEIPRGLGLTVYRVVQEGLTNTMRHAPGAATVVEITTTGDGTVVEIVNGPAARAATSPMGTGSGLLGLAERLRLYQGTLDARPTATGGFRLRARIPTAPDPDAPNSDAPDPDAPSPGTASPGTASPVPATGRVPRGGHADVTDAAPAGAA